WNHKELELSLRYYDQDFLNPHTGAIAEPDEVDGQRARDEAGVRLRFGGKVTRAFSLHGLVDFWEQISASIAKIRIEVRPDYAINRFLKIGVIGRYQDKDLSVGGHGQCYDIVFLMTEDGEPVPCKGRKIDLAPIVTVTPTKKMRITGEALFRFIDDQRYTDK